MRDILNEAEKAGQQDDLDAPINPAGNGSQKWPKRFYKDCSLVGVPEGFEIRLDERPVKTPGKSRLVLPGSASAQLVVDEWQAVDQVINPVEMPVSRIVNTAIDGVAAEMQAVFEDIIRYAGSDLLCYRAESPGGLVEKQEKHWDPLLDWLQSETGAIFEVASGIMHVEQAAGDIRKFSDRLARYKNPFALACLHTFTSISGSSIIALALAEGHLDSEQAWTAAHVDEDWNISQWGEDFDAAEKRKLRWREFDAADRLLRAIRQDMT